MMMSGKAMDDNTGVIRMLGTLDSFLREPHTNVVHQVDQVRPESKPEVMGHLNFDTSSLLEDTVPTDFFHKSADETEKRLLEAELVSAKAHIAKLETDMGVLQTNYSCFKTEMEKKLEISHQKEKKDKETIAELHRKLTFLAEQEESARMEAQQYKYRINTHKTDQKMMQLEREKRKLMSDLSEVEQTMSNFKSQHRQEQLRLQGEIKMAQTESHELKAKMRQLLKRNQDSSNQAQLISKLKLELEELRCHNMDLEQKLSRLKEAEVLSSTIASEVTKINELEAANRILREDNNYLKSTAENTLLLKEKILGLEAALERSQQRCEELEQWKIENQPDCNPRETKVIHFKMNPTSMALKQRSEELTQLKTECEMLRARVKLLEESGGKVADLTVQVDEQIQNQPTPKELEDMKAQMRASELKNQRLMEVFRKTSTEFREVCYMLLGYQIDIPVRNQYRLRSMYAETPEDCLLFQQNKNGLSLLENDYSRTLTEMLELYLKQRDSIPAFLSSLTLELFNKQTHMVS